jgi:hypothetical protein
MYSVCAKACNNGGCARARHEAVAAARLAAAPLRPSILHVLGRHRCPCARPAMVVTTRGCCCPVATSVRQAAVDQWWLRAPGRPRLGPACTHKPSVPERHHRERPLAWTDARSMVAMARGGGSSTGAATTRAWPTRVEAGARACGLRRRHGR